MKICIGIISYLPDEEQVRQERLNKLANLIVQCNYIFNQDIIIIAQNWKNLKLNLKTSNKIFIYNYKNKLGIIGARRELRKKFLESEYDYLIMLDDDCKIIGTQQMGESYLYDIQTHPNMWAWFKPNLLKLFAISKEVFSKIEYPEGEIENGAYFEDMYLTNVCALLYPLKRFNFKKVGLTEVSDSAHDINSTWFHNQFDKHEIGDRTRAMLKELNDSLWKY